MDFRVATNRLKFELGHRLRLWGTETGGFAHYGYAPKGLIVIGASDRFWSDCAYPYACAQADECHRRAHGAIRAARIPRPPHDPIAFFEASLSSPIAPTDGMSALTRPAAQPMITPSSKRAGHFFITNAGSKPNDYMRWLWGLEGNRFDAEYFQAVPS